MCISIDSCLIVASLKEWTNTIQHNNTRLHSFNGPLSRSTRVSRYQKGKTNLDFTGAADSEWQWHQLGHMQVCTSLQTDNHASTPPLSSFTGRMPFLPPNQQRQSTTMSKVTTDGAIKTGKIYKVSKKCWIFQKIVYACLWSALNSLMMASLQIYC